MRNVLFAAGTLALACVSSPELVRSALVASASSLFEAMPFVFAGILASLLLQRRAEFAEYFGCCGCVSTARSLPAAAATWLVFGPTVAIARYVAATFAARILRRRLDREGSGVRENVHPLGELAAILPSALLAGAAMQIAAFFDPGKFSAAGGALLGAVLGFTAAPCGLGAIALAGALRVHAPYAAAAFLCLAGIVDLRALRRTRHATAEHDAFGYVLLAAALGIVAWRRGDALVHPAFTAALGCCAVAALLCAVVYRRCRSSAARHAPALMLVGALVGAPPPQYHATETTLTDVFAGERLTFTGALQRERGASTVVRYAITCCRADAAPVAVRLDRTPPYPAGTWLRVDGRIETAENDIRLVAKSIQPVVAPSDPFIYR
jgi:hypothetical protein